MADPFISALTKPQRVYSRSEVLGGAVPRESGIYAWYFREVPPGVPTTDCVRHGDLTLLYAGIAPRAPSTSGAVSKRTLRDRMRNHMSGNAASSTLRRTLGCLLRDQIGTVLRRVGTRRRLTFHTAEANLSQWMEQNAFVCWATTPEPWHVETRVISSVNLPLNLDQNRDHSFHRTLSELRRDARIVADGLPVV